MTIQEELLVEGLKELNGDKQAQALWLNQIQNMGGVSQECEKAIREVIGDVSIVIKIKE